MKRCPGLSRHFKAGSLSEKALEFSSQKFSAPLLTVRTRGSYILGRLSVLIWEMGVARAAALMGLFCGLEEIGHEKGGGQSLVPMIAVL